MTVRVLTARDVALKHPVRIAAGSWWIIAADLIRHLALADRLGLPITVCHYPPGTSKWNQIEHRMFSFISLNWRGQPLVSYETVINLISRTTTRTGLKIKALLDNRDYDPGVKISDQDMAQLRITAHTTHPQWNYTINPRPRRSHEN